MPAMSLNGNQLIFVTLTTIAAENAEIRKCGKCGKGRKFRKWESNKISYATMSSHKGSHA
jgi:hypothetical protein